MELLQLLVEDDVATFKCADSTEVQLPRDLLHRSSLLLQVLEDSLEATQGTHVSISLPHGVLCGWISSLRALEVDSRVSGSQGQSQAFTRFDQQQDILSSLKVRLLCFLAYSILDRL